MVKFPSKNSVRKYYPLAGRKSPYIIMSTKMVEDDCLRFSREYSHSRTPHGSGNFKVWKILIVACLCLTVTVLIHQCFHLEKYYQQPRWEEIVIITSSGQDESPKDEGFEGKSKGKDFDVVEPKPNNNGHKKCTPGAVMKRDCNPCTCSDSGDWACTKMFCGKANGQKLDIGLVDE